MKVLVLLFRDVNNIPAKYIVDKLAERGHQVSVYAKFMDYIHIRMFLQDGYVVNDYNDLDKNAIDDADFIFSAMTFSGFPELTQTEKYIFSYSTTFLGDFAVYADYTFQQRDFLNGTISADNKTEQDNYIKTSPGKAIGNPKFDNDRNISCDANDKQILYVDTGHFPFGRRGKIQIAQMLLNIAYKFIDYTIIVKPRFLPGDGNVTHRNSNHIYYCINELCDGNIPSNLVLLNEHCNLEKLVRESGFIITPDLTSTYLDIGVFNKRGVVVSGIETEFPFSHPESYMKLIRGIVARSGLCVNYNEVLNYIPDGKPYNKSHWIEMGLDKENAADSAVSIMESIYSEYLQKGVYPSPFDGISETDFAQVISARYIKRLFETYDTLEQKLENVDFSEVSDVIYNLWNTGAVLSKEEYELLRTELSRKVLEIIISNKSRLMDTEYKQSYYIKALNDNGLLQNENIEEYSAKEMFHWCMGVHMASREKNYFQAIEHFNAYYDLYSQNKYERTLADLPYSIRYYYLWVGVSYFESGNPELAMEFFEECRKRVIAPIPLLQEYLNKYNQ